MQPPKRDYQSLDAVAVVGATILVGGSICGLMLIKIPESQLPIVASLVSSMVSTVIGGYAGFRWGASQKDVAPAAQTGSATVAVNPTVTPAANEGADAG